MSCAILDDSIDYIKNYINLDNLKKSKIIFVVFQVAKNNTMLIIIDYPMNEHYIINPKTLTRNEVYIQTGELLLEKINDIRGRKNHLSVLGDIEHDTRGSGLLSNILICSYLKNYINDSELINLNLNKIGEIVSDLLLINTEINDSVKPKQNQSAPQCSSYKSTTLKSRRENCLKLLNSVFESDPDSIMNEIIKKFNINESTNRQRHPFLGNVLR